MIWPSRSASAVGIAEQFHKLGIRSVTNAPIRGISPGQIELVNGHRLPFAYAVLFPPLLGIDAVRACDAITNASGFVRVNQFCQTHAYPEVFAAGGAAAGGNASPDEMGKIAARNIDAHIHGDGMIGGAAAAA